MTQLMLFEMVTAYGYDGPFDERVISLSKTQLATLPVKLRSLCAQLQKLTKEKG